MSSCYFYHCFPISIMHLSCEQQKPPLRVIDTLSYMYNILTVLPANDTEVYVIRICTYIRTYVLIISQYK